MTRRGWAWQNGNRPDRPRQIANGKERGADLEKNILAFDPGKTTGFSMFEQFDNGDWFWHVWELPYNPIEIVTAVRNWSPTKVVGEYYEITPRTREREAIEVCAFIQLFLLQAELDGVEYQKPSQAQGLVTNDLIKSHGLWAPGLRNANESTRHLLYYLITKLNQTWWLEPLKNATSD